MTVDYTQILRVNYLMVHVVFQRHISTVKSPPVFNKGSQTLPKLWYLKPQSET
jgi:hypothetical protein